MNSRHSSSVALRNELQALAHHVKANPSADTLRLRQSAASHRTWVVPRSLLASPAFWICGCGCAVIWLCVLLALACSLKPALCQ